MTDGPRKNDKDKPPLDMVPRRLLEGTARALAYGVQKYGRHNWRKPPGFRVTRLLAAALRHIHATTNGEITDPESGLDHLDHAASALAFAMSEVIDRPWNDDRWRPEAPPDRTSTDRGRDTRGSGPTKP